MIRETVRVSEDDRHRCTHRCTVLLSAILLPVASSCGFPAPDDKAQIPQYRSDSLDVPVDGIGFKTAVLQRITADKFPDLAVAHPVAAKVTVFANITGANPFAQSTDHGLVPAPSLGSVGLAAGTLSEDGRIALVATHRTDNSVSVFLNPLVASQPGPVDPLNPFILTTTGSNPSEVAIVDLDGDGKNDIVVTVDNGINVFRNLGNTDGGGTDRFATPIVLPAPRTPVSLASGDLDADGNADLVVADKDGNVLVFWGDGTVTPPLPTIGTRVAVGDLNHDTKPDIAIVNTTANTVTVLINNGDKLFADGISFATGNGPSFVAIGTIDFDDFADLVVVAREDRRVNVLLHNGRPTFDAETFGDRGEYPTPPAILDALPIMVAIGDLNADRPDGQAPDLVVTKDNGVTVLFHVPPPP